MFQASAVDAFDGKFHAIQPAEREGVLDKRGKIRRLVQPIKAILRVPPNPNFVPPVGLIKRKWMAHEAERETITGINIPQSIVRAVMVPTAFAIRSRKKKRA
ncbi:hypothetical protein A3D88_04645 [Candidatus Peribacteria bacterium RIFCSPHIGHO2_02_FULL_52_16]|nr:MAG: hypothetical protein A2706_03275 [Candidatus Peribacteria bacterium RIFCSPHIGHO2_01_FULL_51_35]OGJ60892.1 MAG: hypothetical protein A3D88_04645 [Candidatus Peribacteria bacterium RIFCSPHIGHO2_02_FULL_52_16]